MPNEFNALAEFRRRYPSAKLTDQEVYRGLANPDNFRAAFPEFSHLDNTVIGRNVAAEAGRVDTGKGVLGETVRGLGEMVTAPFKKLLNKEEWTNPQDPFKAGSEQLQKDISARKAEGRSVPYRAAANTLEGLGLFNPRPMEEAANQGHTGEVWGKALPPIIAAAAPLVGEGLIKGTMAARRGVMNMAMEEPVVARQRAMNVAAKSKQAIRAQKEGTRAAPYLRGSKNLADVQARIPAAKQEIFQPYMDAVDRATAAGRQLQGPDGPVTPRELEQLRQETSAQLQSTRKMQPTEQWTAVQKNQQIAQLTRRYQDIVGELDPVIRDQGIDPKRTRATFGAVKGVEKRFEGRSTLLENKPSGLGKMGAKFDITKPFKDIGSVAEGARDIAAGRGLFRQKPTDVQVREGFRTAGPKPDLTVRPPAGQAALPPGPLVTPPPQPGPPNLTPPPVAGTSRAQRMGLILPEHVLARPELPTGYTEPAAPGAVNYGEAPPAAPPPVPAEAPIAQPANTRIVRDPKTGRMKRQYLTSAGGQIIREEPITVQEALAAKPAEATKVGAPIGKVKLAESETNIDIVDSNGTILKSYKNTSQGKEIAKQDLPRWQAQADEMANPAEATKAGSTLKPTATMEIPAELKTKLDAAGLINKGEVMPGSGVFQVEHPDAPGKTFTVKMGDTPEVMKQKAQAKIAEFKPKTESPAAAAKARGAELQAGRSPEAGERRISSPAQRERFDMHQSMILDLKDKLRTPGITAKSKANIQDMIRENERAMEAVKRGDPAEMARDFGPVKFPRAGDKPKPIEGVTGIKKRQEFKEIKRVGKDAPKSIESMEPDHQGVLTSDNRLILSGKNIEHSKMVESGSIETEKGKGAIRFSAPWTGKYEQPAFVETGKHSADTLQRAIKVLEKLPVTEVDFIHTKYPGAEPSLEISGSPKVVIGKIRRYIEKEFGGK